MNPASAMVLARFYAGLPEAQRAAIDALPESAADAALRAMFAAQKGGAADA